MAITAIVRFALPEGKTRESATAAFEASAPLYRGVQGLCCKPDVGVSQIRTTTVLSSCFCVGQTVL